MSSAKSRSPIDSVNVHMIPLLTPMSVLFIIQSIARQNRNGDNIHMIICSKKKCSGVLCDRRMPVKLKGKVYRTVVRPAMLYGAETWATTKRQESRIEVNEMRMLRWMCGVTRKDKIRNEHIRGTTKIVQASRKITERRLKWYGHVMRMEEDHVVRRVMTNAIPGKRKRGRPKTRWKDVCKRDMQTVGLREGDEGDRAYWKETINNHSGDPR